MKALFVCGPWGSGTSIVARILIRLGAIGLSPYVITRDPKTGNSYESVVFRDLMLKLADDKTFSLLMDRKVAFAEIEKFRTEVETNAQSSNIDLSQAPLVLKFALSCLFIEELNQIFEAKFIFVRRELDEIEFGRLRRNWEPFLGAEGARKVYSSMNKYSHWNRGMIYTIKYRQLLDNPIKEVEGLAKFCNLRSDKASVKSAAESIMEHPNYRAAGKRLELR